MFHALHLEESVINPLIRVVLLVHKLKHYDTGFIEGRKGTRLEIGELVL